MKDYKLISDKEREHLFSMLIAGPLDMDSIPNRFTGVAYGDDPMQKMNIYLPDKGDGPFPVIFFIHGGGWRSGSRNDTQVRPFLPGLEMGYAVISCGYRFLPDTHYPENLYDIKAALRFIKANNEKYKLDASRIAIAGASAGGHLALMAAFTQKMPAFEGGSTADAPEILAVVDQFAPTDFLSEEAQYDESGFARADPPAEPGHGTHDDLLGMDTTSNPALCAFLSPVSNVHPGIPPVLILHGKYDPMVPYQQSTELYNKICRVCGNDRAVLIISDDCTHADTKYEKEPYTSEIFEFLKKHLKK